MAERWPWQRASRRTKTWIHVLFYIITVCRVIYIFHFWTAAVWGNLLVVEPTFPAILEHPRQATGGGGRRSATSARSRRCRSKKRPTDGQGRADKWMGFKRRNHRGGRVFHRTEEGRGWRFSALSNCIAQTPIFREEGNEGRGKGRGGQEGFRKHSESKRPSTYRGNLYRWDPSMYKLLMPIPARARSISGKPSGERRDETWEDMLEEVVLGQVARVVENDT